MKTIKHLTYSLLPITYYLALALCASAAVLDEVTFDIQEGWNAIYLPVTPEGSADKVFAN